MQKCDKCGLTPILQTLGEKPFGTSHWAGTYNGMPAITLSFYGGATLFYFDESWKKITFSSLSECHQKLGIN